jgi:DNA polymerase
MGSRRVINIFVDYETFWGVKYSLRTAGMSYTDYVSHEKFQIHGASVSIEDEEPQFLNAAELKVFFRLCKENQANGTHQYRMICHNALFDGIITTLTFGFIADEYFCTLAMVDALFQGGVGRGLDECMHTLLGWKTGKTDIIKKIKDMRTEDIPKELWDELLIYANDDLRATIQLYNTYGPLLPAQEHQIMSIVLRMFLDPVLVFNEEVLNEAIIEADTDRESRIAPALALGSSIEELKGNSTFPALLERMGIVVPMKPSPTVEGKMIPALAKTDPGFQQMLESRDEIIKALATGRLAVKSTQATTRAYRFKKMHTDFGLFAVAYNYARAHTWRVSGANKINPANLKRGSKLRTCIEAPEGYILGVADASQIECRANGYIAGQDDLMQLFREKRDPYNEMATDIVGRTIDRKNNPDDFFEGFLGKTATLGLGFQMGGPHFKSTVEEKSKVDLDLDIEFDISEAYRIVNLYRQKNWKIEEMWEHCKEFLFAMLHDKTMYWDYADDSLWIDGKNNKIFFPNGTWLYYPGLDYDSGQFTYLNKQGNSWKTKYIYGGLLDENIVQKFARDITSHHLVQIADRFRAVMHTYDENIALIPEDIAEEGTQWMTDLMKVPPKWAASIPLDAEGGFAKEYSK